MFRFSFQKTSLVPKSFLRKRKEISEYLKKLRLILKERKYNFPESFLNLPEEKISFFSFSQISKKLKLIIVAGIGGSSRGAQAVYGALKNKKNLTEILFLDALSPFFLQKISSQHKELKKGEIAIILSSKSGRTLETLANFFAIFPTIKKYKPEIFVVTEENSLLWNLAKIKGWQPFSAPKIIEGRYSVFSNLGLLPLYLAGVNVQELLLGAKDANEVCLFGNALKNPALASAMIIFYHWQSKKAIYSNIVSPPDLEFFGKWYQQLMAESLGKDRKGITPTVIIGTTDFHSLLQLYLAGPKDKLFNFVLAENLDLDYPVPKSKELNLLLPSLQGKSIWELNRAILGGVKRAFLKKEIPFTETVLPKLKERNLGFLFQMKMIEMILLAKLMEVNPFGQPAVELYKEETRKILKRI